MELRLEKKQFRLGGHSIGSLLLTQEQCSTKELTLYKKESGGASTKLDTIDRNYDYYAGGADGWEAFTKETYMVTTHADHAIVLSKSDEGRGNKSGYRYEMALSPKAYNDHYFEYEDEL